MSASIITVFNTMTGDDIESKETYEALLEEFYDKFIEVYHVIKDLPKKHIDGICCLKLEGNALGFTIDIKETETIDKVYNKLINKLPTDGMFEITIQKISCGIWFVVRDREVE